MLPDTILIFYKPPHCVIDIGRKEQVFLLARNGFPSLLTEVVLPSNWLRKLTSFCVGLSKSYFHIPFIGFPSHCWPDLPVTFAFDDWRNVSIQKSCWNQSRVIIETTASSASTSSAWRLRGQLKKTIQVNSSMVSGVMASNKRVMKFTFFTALEEGLVRF